MKPWIKVHKRTLRSDCGDFLCIVTEHNSKSTFGNIEVKIIFEIIRRDTIYFDDMFHATKYAERQVANHEKYCDECKAFKKYRKESVEQ